MASTIALRLALRQWLARPLRPILCSIAIAASVALVVCIGAGFDSLRYTLRTTIGQMLGVADVYVKNSVKASGSRLPKDELATIRALPNVEFASGRMQSHVAVSRVKENGERGEPHWVDVLGIDPVWDEKMRPKIFVAGHSISGKPNELAIDSIVAEMMGTKVGDTVSVSVDGKTQRPCKVVGIIKKPMIELLARPTVYMSAKELAEEFHAEEQYNVIDVKIKNSDQIQDYDAEAAALNKTLGPMVVVTAGTHSQAKMSMETRVVQVILSLISTVAALCAALIIGTTLSVGVQERVRQFGQLRCIGASRFQLATFLIADAAVMLAIGEIVGLLLGFGLAMGLVWWFPQYFMVLKMSWAARFIAAAVGILATMLGAAIPIWQVSRVTPMAAVSVIGRWTRRRSIWIAAEIGLGCLALQQILWHAGFPKEVQATLYICIGAPAVFVGLALLGPAALTLCERVAAKVIGTLFGVRSALLRNSWSGTPWRAGAMVAALMIGVTLFTAVGARGESLQNSWVSPAKMPDLMLISLVDSIPILPMSSVLPDAVKRGEEIKNKHPEIADLTTISSFAVKIKTVFTKGGPVLGIDTPHFVGVDPVPFSRLVEMDYVQGDPATAVKQLAEGGHIFVTKEFMEFRGLGVGDKVTFVATNGKPVDFTIAAVVTSTGMELVKNYFDLRSVFQDHSLTAFLGNIKDAQEYFRSKSGTLMLANLKKGVSPAQIKVLREQLSDVGYPSVSSLELKSGLRRIINNVVVTLKIIALGALIVASLGVANMVIASVHARRFEFGVLRAIGAGRGQLIRLVLAEVTLIGLVAGVLGTAAGLYYTAMAMAMDRLMVGFQSAFLSADAMTAVVSALVHLGLALLVTTVLAWLAAIVPATKGAFSAQRTLLASGRG